MHVLTINAHSSTAEDIRRLLAPIGYKVAEGRDAEAMATWLGTTNQSVIVLVDFPDERWAVAEEFLQHIISNFHMWSYHAFILIMYANDHLPKHLLASIQARRLPITIIARPLQPQQLLAAIQDATVNLTVQATQKGRAIHSTAS